MSVPECPQPLNDCELVGNFGVPGHQFTNVDARDVGADGVELATKFHRRIRLHVVHVEMTGATGQVDHDDRLVTCFGPDVSTRSKPKQIRDGQASHAQTADLQEVTTSHSIAEITCLPSGDIQHRESHGPLAGEEPEK